MKKSVVCLETSHFFQSITSAARFYGADPSDVSKCCRGIVRVAAGHHFRFCDSPAVSIEEIDASFVAKRRRVEIRRQIRPGILAGRDALGRRSKGPESMAKPVVCLTDGKVFPSASQAARFYDVDIGALTQVCNGKRFRKTAGGRRFAYMVGA